MHRGRSRRLWRAPAQQKHAYAREETSTHKNNAAPGRRIHLPPTHRPPRTTTRHQATAQHTEPTTNVVYTVSNHYHDHQHQPPRAPSTHPRPPRPQPQPLPPPLPATDLAEPTITHLVCACCGVGCGWTRGGAWRVCDTELRLRWRWFKAARMATAACRPVAARWQIRRMR